MKLKTLIIDDEYSAREELRHYLKKYDILEVIGEAGNAIEAIHLITELNSNLLFLDISLPGGSAFSVIEKIQHMPQKPWIIFVTAHDNFAADAFEVDAIDYIMKPIDPLRLKKALQKVFKLVNFEEKENKPTIKVGLIPVDIKEKTILIPEKDIVFFEAQDDYTYVKTLTNKYLTGFTLRELEARVSKEQFMRCHRSYLLNLARVIEVSSQANGTLLLTVNDEVSSKVPVSRAQTKKVRQLLGM